MNKREELLSHRRKDAIERAKRDYRYAVQRTVESYSGIVVNKDGSVRPSAGSFRPDVHHEVQALSDDRGEPISYTFNERQYTVEPQQ